MTKSHNDFETYSAPGIKKAQKEQQKYFPDIFVGKRIQV